MKSGEEYYDKRYFKWLNQIEKFGAIDDVEKFKHLIRGDEDILDFGCGGGTCLS